MNIRNGFPMTSALCTGQAPVCVFQTNFQRCLMYLLHNIAGLLRMRRKLRRQSCAEVKEANSFEAVPMKHKMRIPPEGEGGTKTKRNRESS